MKTYRLAKLEKDLELVEMEIRLAIKAKTIKQKDAFLFHIAGILGMDVEDLNVSTIPKGLKRR